MHDVTEGGVLTAAHEIATASGVGVRVDADRIPVPEETQAICRYLGVDPLALIGSGALLIATPDSARSIEAVRAAGVPVAEIGEFLGVAESSVVRRGGHTVPLVPAVRDELWRILDEAPGHHT